MEDKVQYLLKTVVCVYMCTVYMCIKAIFLSAQRFFIGYKLRQVSISNFHRKAPKRVKNQGKGSKIYQIRTKLHPTC